MTRLAFDLKKTHLRTAASALTVLSLAGLLMTSGCGNGGAAHLVPDDQLAREALTKALDAWKAGGKAEDELQLPQGPKVRAIDLDWRGGRKLESYEIGESLPITGEEPRQFKVRIDCDGQDAKDTIYHVVGKDPLLVFRDEYMKKTTGM